MGGFATKTEKKMFATEMVIESAMKRGLNQQKLIIEPRNRTWDDMGEQEARIENQTKWGDISAKWWDHQNHAQLSA